MEELKLQQEEKMLNEERTEQERFKRRWNLRVKGRKRNTSGTLISGFYHCTRSAVEYEWLPGLESKIPVIIQFVKQNLDVDTVLSKSNEARKIAGKVKQIRTDVAQEPVIWEEIFP